nr:hypothetical protein [Tanacetum cinerariifolium]
SGGEDQGDNGDAGGEDIASSPRTSKSDQAGIDNQQDPPQGPRRHRPLDAPQDRSLEHTQVAEQ